ncbi:MAG: hypothetical protein WBB28_00495 [Crinalium sp.]
MTMIVVSNENLAFILGYSGAIAHQKKNLRSLFIQTSHRLRFFGSA